MGERMDKTHSKPVIGKVRISDLQYALASGTADFMRAPQFGLFFGGFYALGGLLLMYGLFGLGLFWLSYPMVIGFALVGPFVATGLYEVSRCLEAGASWIGARYWALSGSSTGANWAGWHL